MATVSTTNDGSDGGVHRRVRATVTFSASYSAGGEAIAPGDFGLGSIHTVDVLSNMTNSGYSVRWDDAAGTLQVFDEGDTATAGMEEVAAATDLSGESITVDVVGRS